ncbi:hypothetical protein VFPPC_18025 [Pochonia chlamydosporia 170]|uniref:Uncharacterized protein n=1 Tax=Pochonia chlamydosporia 170 TaxID=1380566 RepID=A0A219APN1_METCM|nr:hypothetical protein VFPPC_18025 [Pochonia chlamydosporia 170]OWT42770.1 hypothetical protein VFPPC_18025 [Pochonia chlamydosporia 170]
MGIQLQTVVARRLGCHLVLLYSVARTQVSNIKKACGRISAECCFLPPCDKRDVDNARLCRCRDECDCGS